MKNKRPKGRVVLFLVEGKSEISVLEPIISEIYDRIDPEIEVRFPIIIEDECEKGGDITSKYGINPAVIEKCIYQLFLKTFFDREKLFPKDILEIVHIVDTDGVYIPDECIKKHTFPDPDQRISYGKDEILTVDVDGIIERNKRKRDNLDHLSSLSDIKVKTKTVKYSVYFFSSNLDHVLYENANLDKRSKTDLAGMYAEQLGNDPMKFIEALEKTSCTLKGMDHAQSWKFIRQDNNSLHRHTNINILFEQLMQSMNIA